MNEFLEDVLLRVTYRDIDQYQGKLASIAEKLLTYSTDITVLLTSVSWQHCALRKLVVFTNIYQLRIRM